MHQPEEAAARRKLYTLIALVVAVIAVTVYQWRRISGDDIVMESRRLNDMIVDWKCLGCGNGARANAGPGPQKCAKCGKDQAYVSLTWSCMTHGPQQMACQYDKESRLVQIRFGGGEWMPAYTEQDSNLKCPTCKSPLMPPGAAPG